MTTTLSPTTALPATAEHFAPVPRPVAAVEVAGSRPDPDPPVPRPAIGPRVFRVCSEPPPVPSAYGAPVHRDRPPEVRRAPAARARPCGQRADPGAPARREPDAAARAVHALVRLLVETYDGRRPLPHLDAHLTPAALGYWRAVTERRHLPGRPRGGATRFTRIHLSRPRPDVAEVAVCLLGDPVPRPVGAPRRARALAARFEETGGRWRCSALRLG